MTVKRHTAFNVIGAVIPMVVSLLTVPAYLAAIGEARFGILSVVWLLLGYFGLFDLGLGMATSHHIASAQGPNAEGERARLFWSALVTNLGLGVLGGLIIWPICHFYFRDVLVGDSATRAEMLASVPWLVLAVPVATTTGVLTGALQGCNRFGKLNLISVIGTIIFQLLPLAAARYWTPSLTVVLPVSIAARSITFAMLWIEVRRGVIGHHPISFSRSSATAMLKFGGWVTVSAFFGPFMSSVDRFAIGGLIGASAVSLYAVPLSLGDRLTIFGNALGSALYPRLSSAPGSKRLPLAVQAEQTLMAAMLPIGVGAIFAIRPFLQLWISGNFADQASSVASVLMIGVFFDSVSRVPLYTLRGAGRPQAVAKVDLLQTIPYFALLYFALTHFGLEGAAWAFVGRVIANYVLLSGETGSLRWTYGHASLGAVLLICSWYSATHLPQGSLSWLVAAAVCGSISAVIALAILPPEQRTRLAAWRSKGLSLQ